MKIFGEEEERGEGLARPPRPPWDTPDHGHKTTRAGLKVAEAAERRETKLGVLAQGFDPPGDVVPC